MGEVVQLPRPKRQTARPMPERLGPEDVQALLQWAEERSYSAEETQYAVERVRDWARTKAKEPLKRDWARTVANAMRDGWALRGFVEEQRRRGRSRRTAITPELVQRMVEKARGD